MNFADRFVSAVTMKIASNNASKAAQNHLENRPIFKRVAV
jgi:hypothetical protein